jgi:transcriptional regulator with XRE-family HTH domain
MARAGLGMTAEQLAAAARVSKVTLSDFEIGKRSPHPRTLAAIRTALESAGVDFIAENGGGAGVRLRKEASTHVK